MFEAKNAILLTVNGIGLLGAISATVAALLGKFRKGFLIQSCSTLLMFFMVSSVYVLSGYEIHTPIIRSAKYMLLCIVASVVVCLSAIAARDLFGFVAGSALKLLRHILGPLDDLLCSAWMVFTKESAASGQSQSSSVNVSGGNWKRDVRLLLEALVIWHTPAIARWLVGALPSANVITNILDLISLVLATPKLFTNKVKKHLFESRFQIANWFVIIIIPYISFRMMMYMDAPVISIFSEFSKSYPDPMGSYIREYMISKLKEVKDFSILMSGFALNVTIVSLVFLIFVIMLNYKISQGNEEELADKALMFSLIIFGYSRAIAMLA